MEHHLAEIQRRFIYRVVPDGHCLLHAWLQCSKEDDNFVNITDTLDEYYILSKLEIELKTNLPYYMNFLPDTVDVLTQFELYRYWKIFNMGTGDILLPALCNCFNVQAFIVEKGPFGNFVLKVHVVPHNIQDVNDIERTYYLLRCGDHYDALITPGKCLLFKEPFDDNFAPLKNASIQFLTHISRANHLH